MTNGPLCRLGGLPWRGRRRGRTPRSGHGRRRPRRQRSCTRAQAATLGVRAAAGGAARPGSLRWPQPGAGQDHLTRGARPAQTSRPPPVIGAWTSHWPSGQRPRPRPPIARGRPPRGTRYSDVHAGRGGQLPRSRRGSPTGPGDQRPARPDVAVAGFPDGMTSPPAAQGPSVADGVLDDRGTAGRRTARPRLRLQGASDRHGAVTDAQNRKPTRAAVRMSHSAPSRKEPALLVPGGP